MAVLLSPLVDFYNFITYDLADPRTNDWFMVKCPIRVFGLIFLYVYLCASLGPRLMANRKRFEIDFLVKLYNVSQIVLNFLLCSEAIQLAYLQRIDIRCQKVDRSNSPIAIREATACWYYFMLKWIELLDTAFFVMRKKQNQVTVLHLYHHGGMVGLAWGIVKYFPGGQAWLCGLLNTAIHVIMYSYYLATMISPEFKSKTMLKKSLTQMQLSQFFIVLIHTGLLLFYDCGYPKVGALFVINVGLLLIILFVNFYIRNYNKGKVIKVKKIS